MSQLKHRNYRQMGLLFLVIFAGLGLTFSATRESVRTSEQQAISDFRAGAELYVDRVRQKMQAGLTAVTDLYRYYKASDIVTRETFNLLVKTNSSLSTNRLFVSLAYAMSPEQEAVFIASMREAYGGPYKIKEPPLPEGSEKPARKFPLFFVWAPNPEKKAKLQGLNVGASPEMNGFLEAAMQFKTSSVIFSPTLPDIDGGKQGLLLMATPFITKNGNEGLMLQLVDFQGLLKSIGAEIPALAQSLRLKATSEWGSVVHRQSFGTIEQGSEASALDPYQKDFVLGAGKWSFTITAAPKAYRIDYGPAVITASVCLLLTGLFYFIVWSQLRRARRVAEIVNRRTRALKEAHDELEEHYKLLQNLNKDVEESRRSAELANCAKSEFLATMSHELRTPLNAILGFSQLLSEQALGPIGDGRYIDYAKDIHSSGSHLLSLINDILDLAKLEAGKISIEKNAVSTRQLTHRVVTLLDQQAKNKNIELYAEFDDNMPDYILGDELRLRQILINLCSNAIKFTHEGSVIARLFSKPFQNGRQGWVLEVQDTGIGIPEEKQATLFDRFTQVDAALSRRHGGVGLGLAICRELVDRMDGTISVRSMVGVGTAVRVHLPLEEASEDPVDDSMMI